MKLRGQAMRKSGGKAVVRRMAIASAAQKRSAAPKKSAKKPAKKPSPAKKSAKKPAPAKKPATPAAKPAPVIAPPRLATPLPAGPLQQPAAAAKPASPHPAASAEMERRRRRLFARLRSLEAIVGADLRKRGSVVLMQAVDHWYAEAASTSATDVSITNAARAVIAQL
jgi:hypothetical protein